MGRRKRKHIYIKDPELQKKIEVLREMFPGMTYDELLKEHLNIPTSDDLIRLRFEEVRDLLVEKYKNEDLFELMNIIWIYIIKSANGEYDIKKLKYDIDADLKLKTYRKR